MVHAPLFAPPDRRRAAVARRHHARSGCRSARARLGSPVASARGRVWFAKDDAFDRQFRDRCLADHAAAALGELADWAIYGRNLTGEGANWITVGLTVRIGDN